MEAQGGFEEEGVRWKVLDPRPQAGEKQDTGRGGQARTGASSALSPKGLSP